MLFHFWGLIFLFIYKFWILKFMIALKISSHLLTLFSIWNSYYALKLLNFSSMSLNSLFIFSKILFICAVFLIFNSITSQYITLSSVVPVPPTETPLKKYSAFNFHLINCVCSSYSFQNELFFVQITIFSYFFEHFQSAKITLKISLNIFKVLKLPWVVLFFVVLKVWVFSLDFFDYSLSLFLIVVLFWTLLLLFISTQVTCLLWKFFIALNHRGALTGLLHVHHELSECHPSCISFQISLGCLFVYLTDNMILDFYNVIVWSLSFLWMFLFFLAIKKSRKSIGSTTRQVWEFM